MKRVPVSLTLTILSMLIIASGCTSILPTKRVIVEEEEGGLHPNSESQTEREPAPEEFEETPPKENYQHRQ